MQNLVFPQSEKEAKKCENEISQEGNKNAMFPRRLRELRAAMRDKNGNAITQQILANEIGVTKSTISLYEMGSNVPDAKTIVKLSEYYNVSTDYLLCETDTATRDADIRGICAGTGLSETAVGQIIKWNMVDKETVSSSGRKIAEKPGQPLPDMIFNTFIENPDLYAVLSQITSLYDTYKTIKNLSSNEDGDVKLNENIFQFSVWRTQNNIYKTILSTVKNIYEKEKKALEEREE